MSTVITNDEVKRRRKILRPIPDSVSVNFDNSSFAPLTDGAGGTITFVNDPTGSGRTGKVVKINYDRVGVPGPTEDVNKSMDLNFRRNYGQDFFCRGEVYVDVNNLVGPGMGRKLYYWQSHKDFGRYSGYGGADNRTVLLLQDDILQVDSVYGPSVGAPITSVESRAVQDIKAGMKGRRWYDIMIQQRLESAIGLADGILRVWVDGILLYEDTNRTWTDAAWIGATGNQDVSWGVAMLAGDIGFANWLVGQQVNATLDYNEDRFWDKVRFSSTIIGNVDTPGSTHATSLTGTFQDVFTDVCGKVLIGHTPTVGTSWIGAVTTGRDFRFAYGCIRGDQGGYLARQNRANKGSAWANNQKVNVDFVFRTLTSDDTVGVVIRGPDAALGGYYLVYQTAFQAFKLMRLTSGGVETSLGTYSYKFDRLGDRVNAELEAVGTTITVKLDDVTVFSVVDATYAAGSPSVYYSCASSPAYGTGIQLDNFAAT